MNSLAPYKKHTHSLSLYFFLNSLSLQLNHLLSISKILFLSRSSIARALSKGKRPKAFASISGNKTQRHHHKQWLLPSPSLSTLLFYFRFHQWRLQEFYPGYSYFTLKKFRVISVYFKCFGAFR